MSDAGFLQVECPMSDFNKSDVGFLKSDVGCWILKSRIPDFYKSDAGWHL